MTAVLDCIVMVINLRLCLPQCFFAALTMQWDVSSVIYMHLLSSYWILICMQIVKSFLRLTLRYVDCSAIKSLQRCSLQQTYKAFFFFPVSICEGLIFLFFFFFLSLNLKEEEFPLHTFTLFIWRLLHARAHFNAVSFQNEPKTVL